MLPTLLQSFWHYPQRRECFNEVLFQDQRKTSNPDKTLNTNGEETTTDKNDADDARDTTNDDQREAEEEQQKNDKDAKVNMDENSDKVKS